VGAAVDDPVSGEPAGTDTNCDPATGEYFASFGGTSTAAPTFAGILAQVRQKAGGRLGQAASELYALAASGNGGTIFHDTTIGNNSVPCDPAVTPDGSCPLNTAGYYFQSGNNTATGYDLSTGLGSVDAKELVTNWPATTGLGGFTVAATNVTVNTLGTPGNSTITITPSGGYTGTVTWVATVTSAPAGAVGLPTFTSSSGLVFTSASSAAQTGTVDVNTTAAMLVRPGTKPNSIELAKNNSWFKAAGGVLFASFLLFFVPGRIRKARNLLMALLLTVACGFTIIGCGGGSSAPTFLTPTVTVTPASGTIAYSSPLNVVISVTGTGATPTGTVTLTSGSYSSAVTTLASGSATVTIPANTFTRAGTYKLTANYSGDTVYNSGTGFDNETVTGPPTTTGNYTVTVVAVGSDAASTTRSTTFTLTVN